MPDFKADLARQRPLELALGELLGAECTDGNIPYDLVFPDRTKAEIKTEVGYPWRRDMNFYMEVCDVKEGISLPPTPQDALERYDVALTGIFRAARHRIDYWLHGVPSMDGKSFNYAWFKVDELREQVLKVWSNRWTGKPIQNKGYVTLGVAVPSKNLVGKAFRVTNLPKPAEFDAKSLTE